MEVFDDGIWRRCEGSGSMENVDVVGESDVSFFPILVWAFHEGESTKGLPDDGRGGTETDLDYMFVGGKRRKNKRWLSWSRVGRRRRLCVFSTVPRTMGEWICRRLMVWHREIGLEFVDIVKSDNEPASTSLIESWSNLRAVKGGSRMIDESVPVGSSKSERSVERAPPVSAVHGQSVARKVGSEAPVDIIWQWIAEHAGVLLKRFEVGRDGKTAYEQLKGSCAKVQGTMLAEGTLWKRKRAGGPLENLTCMWEDDRRQVKSSWETEAACGSQGRSRGSRRDNDRKDTTCTRSWEFLGERTRTIPRWTVRTSREASWCWSDYKEKLGKRGARSSTEEAVQHARKLVLIQVHCGEGVPGQSSRETGEANETDSQERTPSKSTRKR